MSTQNTIAAIASQQTIIGFHRTLLADEPRTNAFAEAIRRTVTPDDVVLDLGSGTGVLAMFAARAGARRIFAIEEQHTADLAYILLRRNGCERVELLHAHSKEVELPERATVLITETLGNFGFDEGILGSVIDAKERLLTRDARIIPQGVAIALAPVHLPRQYGREVEWWSEPRYGFDFSPARLFAANHVYGVELGPSALVAEAAIGDEIDLATVESAEVAMQASFLATRAGVVHGFAGWFHCTLVDGITLTNEPPLATPNWGHAFFPLEQPATVTAGTPIEIELESHDGMQWFWRGRIGDRPFDGTSYFASPPCRKESSR